MAAVYRPVHQQQLKEPITGRYDCSGYSGAIAIDRATIGGVKVTGRDIRLASNEPKPDLNPHTENGPGLNLEQVTAAAYRLTRVLLTPRRGSWAVAIGHLVDKGLLLPGDYDQFGIFTSQSSFRDLHMVYVNNLNSFAIVAFDGKQYGPRQAGLTYDPLAKTFRWVPLAVLRKYAEKYARARGYTGGVIYATTRATPLIEA